MGGRRSVSGSVASWRALLPGALLLGPLLLGLGPRAHAQETSPKGYIEMPQATDGAWVLTSPPGSGHNWGQPAFVRFLALVAREWKRRHPEGPVLRIGDMSRPDGADFPPHKTHKDGLTADLFTTPKNVCHVNFPDQSLTVELAKLMHDLGARQILYNGPQVVAAVPVAQKYPDHDDHFHVVIDPARVPADGELVLLPEAGFGEGGWVPATRLDEDKSGLVLAWRVLGQAKLKHWQVLFDDLDDANGVLHDSGPQRGSGSTYKVPVALEHGRRYRWRLELTQADGQTATLDWQRLTADLEPPAVEALTPRDEAELDAPPSFTWRYRKSGVEQAAWWIELDLDRNHKKVAATLGPFDGAGSEHALDATAPLRPDKKYWWRVVVRDAHGNEAGSEWRMFHTTHGYDPQRPAGAGPAGSEPAPANARGVVGASSLNLRAGPGTDKQVLGALPKGTAVKILSEVPGWLEVEATVDGKPLRGFVSAQFIER